jgi:hypothetical protein
MFRRWSGAQTASHSVGTRCSSVRAKRARREANIQRINIHVVLISDGNTAPRVDSTWWRMSLNSWALQMTSAAFMHYSGNTATSAITSAGCPTTMTALISRNPMLTVSVLNFVDASWLTYQLPTQVHCAHPRNCSVFYATQKFLYRGRKGSPPSPNLNKMNPIHILSPWFILISSSQPRKFHKSGLFSTNCTVKTCFHWTTHSNRDLFRYCDQEGTHSYGTGHLI